MFAALRVAASAVLYAAAGFVVALAVLTSFSGLFALRSFAVLSGSMEPALRTGGMVFDETIRPLDARPGDIVTFPDPTDRSRLITHRVRSLLVRDGRVYVTSRGDANGASERWNVPADQRIGRVAYHVPRLGYARNFLAGAPGRLAAAVLVLLWGVAALVAIWRPRPAKPARSAAR